MVDKVAGLSLDVDVSQVQRAVKSLKEFASANDKASDSVHEFIQAETVAKQKAREHANAIKDQAKEYDGVARSIDPTIDKMAKLRAASQKLDELWKKGAVGDKEFFRLGEVLESQSAQLLKAQKMLTAEGRAAIEESRAKEQAAAKAQAFVASLQNQVNMLGKTNEELLQMKAAQMGVAAEAAPLIAQLTSQGKALNAAGISAGEYRQAMRMLPAQLTDVATSLAGGMPIWLVAIQQGGQIKDSFGGIIPTLKVLLTYLNPFTVGIGLAATALGALSYSVIKSNSDFQKIRDNIKDTTGLAGDFADQVTMAVQNLSDATGKTAEEISKAYISTKDGAAEALTKLTDVGVSYSDAIEMVKKYKNESNFTLLNGEIAAHQDKIAELKKSWYDVALEKAKAFGLGAFALTSGGMTNLVLQKEQLKQLSFIERAKQMQKDVEKVQEESRKELAATTNEIEKQYYATNRVADAERNLKEARKLSAKVANSGNKEAIAQAESLIKMRQRELDDAKKAEKKRGETKKPKKTPIVRGATEQLDKELFVLQAQLNTLKQHKDIGDRISTQRKALWAIEGQINVLEEAQTKRRLTGAEKELLAKQKVVLESAKQKAILGDQILQQERANALQEKSLQFINQMNAKIEANKGSVGLSSQAAERQAEMAKLKADYINDGGKENDAQLQKLLDKQQEFYDSEDAKRSDWLNGLKSGVADAAQSFGDMYGNMKEIGMAAMNGLSDTMANFLMTGKADFADFAKSIIGMIIKMITQMVIFNTIAGLTGGKGMSFAGMAGGGAAAPAMGAAPAAMSAAAPAAMTFAAAPVASSLASAAGVAVSRNIAAAHSTPRASNQSVGGLNVDVSGMKLEVNNGGDPAGMQKGIEVLFSQMITQSCSQGGTVYNFIQQKTGG